MNSIKIALFSLFVAGSVHAADETVKFVSLDACKAYHAKLTPASTEPADKYCSGKIMSFVEACTATKISEHVKANKLKSFADLTNTEQMNLKSKFSFECQKTAQTEQASAAQQAYAKKQAKEAKKASSGGGSDSSQKTAQTAALVGALAPLATTLANEIGAAQKAATTATATAPAAVQPAPVAASAPTANSSAAAQIAAPPAAVASSTTASPLSANPAAPPSAASALPQSGPVTAIPGTQTSGTMTAAEGAKAVEAGAAAKAEVAGAAKEVSGAMPETKKAVDELSDTTAKVNAETAPPAPTTISEFAKATSQKMQATIDGVTNNVQNQTMGMYGVQYAKSATAFSQFRQEAFQYTSAAKSKCADLAEKASFLCIEGTSPLAIGAKKVMDTAGPILAVANSAINACSSTAKVTRLVGLGLTAAKGICVASKLACDFTCGSAVKDLGKMQASIQPNIGGAIDADWGTNNSMCSAKYSADTTGTSLASCMEENERIKQGLIAYARQLVEPLKTENVPETMGTSPAIVKSCQGHMKDIILFGVQAAGSFVAHKNAKECERKLASSGAGGATITTQQYCEKSENASSQLCVCQKNSMAEGCPGAVVTTSSKPSENSSADKGTNIKAVQGNSAFAGGFGGDPKQQAIGKPNLSKDSINGALTGAGSPAASGDPGTYGSGGSVSDAGSGSGGFGSASAGKDAARSKKGEEEKKKWSFGAFESATGSLGGFGGGSYSGKGNKSGALTAQDQVAIERKIASERYAAEVSNASGKSNWEKVRKMYILKEGSFIFGQ